MICDRYTVDAATSAVPSVSFDLLNAQ